MASLWSKYRNWVFGAREDTAFRLSHIFCIRRPYALMRMLLNFSGGTVPKVEHKGDNFFIWRDEVHYQLTAQLHDLALLDMYQRNNDQIPDLTFSGLPHPNFRLEVRRSQIEGANKGLYLGKGGVKRGQVVCLQPGMSYFDVPQGKIDQYGLNLRWPRGGRDYVVTLDRQMWIDGNPRSQVVANAMKHHHFAKGHLINHSTPSPIRVPPETKRQREVLLEEFQRENTPYVIAGTMAAAQRHFDTTTKSIPSDSSSESGSELPMAGGSEESTVESGGLSSGQHLMAPTPFTGDGVVMSVEDQLLQKEIKEGRMRQLLPLNVATPNVVPVLFDWGPDFMHDKNKRFARAVMNKKINLETFVPNELAWEFARAESEYIPGCVYVALRDIHAGEELLADYEWEYNINYIKYAIPYDVLVDWPWYRVVDQSIIDTLIEPFVSKQGFDRMCEEDWRLRQEKQPRTLEQAPDSEGISAKKKKKVKRKKIAQ